MTPTLDLFATDAEPARNLLPADGEVYDHGRVYGDDEALALFSALLDEVAWQHDELVIAGKRLVTARQVAWYGDREEAYRYSGSTKVARPWTPLLLAVRQRVEAAVGSTFNACLLNLYRNGDEGMSWHSDDEGALGRTPTIASLSLGARRRFDLRHKADRRKVSLVLDSGQLVVMAGVTQRHWEHALPKTKQVRTPRINLTFRTIIGPP
ncbi:MAG: alpha-ketoglutarate-dependent dioxygenase AlkB [Sandaracinaceae bacterium]|jgi:alkylated DNA repair dioxygenase AlkB|nr:alpha-ketoglutarate-dependent dioxygenase AlkB [Sandaracinaceae bacterium]MBK7154572.1 alpha-ketoglutarate-dependent dioxygenase AlkB [Sandaracinaceae bacterium]MBK7775532.1 alpha-ketoglutarate-dependent dioxygenase AlkB [Sandaracinaceae bacterium]MBK8406490.1 alpha-ketoglutarate-dependent dioxygenase AlkB [Sandaracinaceae bacterium]